MRENPIDVAVCTSCESKLFTQETLHMISFDKESGQYISTVNTNLWCCALCGVYTKESRPGKAGQANSVRRSIESEIVEDKITKPTSTRIDLNEITGNRKPLLRRQGGLSNLGAGIPSSDS